MKLRDLIANLDLSLDLKHSHFEEVSRFLNPDYIENGHDYSKWEKRFGCLYLKERICTDTTVGMAIHLLDKRPVLVSNREGRGCPTVFEVIDPSLIDDLRAFVKECDHVKPIDEYLPPANLDQEMEIGYTPKFSFDLKKNQRVWFKTHWVLIAQDPDRFDYNFSPDVDVTFGGDIITVKLEDIRVPWQSQKETA